MFIDASAMVAIIAVESEGRALGSRFGNADRRLTSGLAVYETVLAVSRKLEIDLGQAEALVTRFLDESETQVVEIGTEEARLAVEAHARFGKGRHPARLNMGDCFAYACARATGAKLLYKGDDFTLTDIEAA